MYFFSFDVALVVIGLFCLFEFMLIRRAPLGLILLNNFKGVFSALMSYSYVFTGVKLLKLFGEVDELNGFRVGAADVSPFTMPCTTRSGEPPTFLLLTLLLKNVYESYESI